MRIRVAWPVMVAAVAVTLVAATTLASVTPTYDADRATQVRKDCYLPNCFASIAFNHKTGYWAKSRNFASRKRVRKQVRRLCVEGNEPNRTDWACVSLGTVKGGTCLAGAKRVRSGEIKAWAAAKRPTSKGAIRAAKAELGGKPEYKRLITSICNG